jgi:hypothetical protein
VVAYPCPDAAAILHALAHQEVDIHSSAAQTVAGSPRAELAQLGRLASGWEALAPAGVGPVLSPSAVCPAV